MEISRHGDINIAHTIININKTKQLISNHVDVEWFPQVT